MGAYCLVFMYFIGDKEEIEEKLENISEFKGVLLQEKGEKLD